MADKRIWELATTSTVRTSKFLAMDSNAQIAAHKYDMGLLVDRISAETIGGLKTFSADTRFDGVVSIGIAPNAGVELYIYGTGTILQRIHTDDTVSSRALTQYLLGPSGTYGYDFGVNIDVSGNDNFTIRELSGGTVQIVTAHRGGQFEIHPGVTLSGLPSDDTEDHLVAIDDATGLLSKRASSTIKPALGTDGQIPIMNALGTDFIYTSSLTYTTGFLVAGQLKISSIAGGAYVLYSTLATGQVRGSSNMTFDGTTLDVTEIALSSGTSVDTIETTLTNDNDHIPTSGAVFTAIGAIPPPISFGLNDEIPYVNSGGTDFDYSTNFRFTGATLYLVGNYDQVGVMEVTSTLTDVGTWNSGSVSGYGRIVVNQSAGGDTQVGFQNNASTKWSIGNDGTADYFKISKGFGAFGTDDYFTIDTNGNVGIGDSTPNDRLTIFDTATQGILIHRNASTANIVTGYLRFESDTVGRYSEISGYRFADSNEQGIRFWTYNTGFVNAMTIGASGTIGVNTDPVANQRIHVQGDTDDWIMVGQHDRPFVAWNNFPTALPNRVLGMHRAGGAVTGGLSDYTALSLACKGGASYASYCVLAVSALSATNNSSRFNVLLRGSGSTDYETVFSADYNSTFLWRSPSTTLDIRHIFIESSTTVGMIGWDYSTTQIKMQVGSQGLGTAPYFYVGTTHYGYYGSTSASMYVDAATSTAYIYLQANTGSDASIYFRENTSTRFIMGHDASVSRFQIHSSTSYSTTADFQIAETGAIGLGVIPHATNRLYIYDSYTAAIWYGLRIWSDGNNVNAQGIYIQCGLDTLTSSDNNYLWCADGNGTTVGTLLADTTSFRLFNAVSSRDYKTNIRDISDDAMAKFRDRRAQPKRYNYIGRTDEERAEIASRGGDPTELIGFVIEDLEQIFPDAVKRPKDENGKETPMYSDTTLIPWIIVALKELDARLKIVEP